MAGTAGDDVTLMDERGHKGAKGAFGVPGTRCSLERFINLKWPAIGHEIMTQKCLK